MQAGALPSFLPPLLSHPRSHYILVQVDVPSLSFGGFVSLVYLLFRYEGANYPCPRSPPLTTQTFIYAHLHYEYIRVTIRSTLALNSVK